MTDNTAPGTQTRPYTVVVGVSATSKSPTALRWSVEEAAARGGRVVAVRTWRPTPPQTGSRGTPAVMAEDLRQAQQREDEQLEQDVREVLGDGHGVECRVLHGGKRKGLLSVAGEADLLVVDAPRRLDLTTSPMLAQRLIHQATCPVVVMPPQISGAGPTAIERAGRALGRNVVEAAGRSGRPGLSHPPGGGTG